MLQQKRFDGLELFKKLLSKWIRFEQLIHIRKNLWSPVRSLNNQTAVFNKGFLLLQCSVLFKHIQFTKFLIRKWGLCNLGIHAEATPPSVSYLEIFWFVFSFEKWIESWLHKNRDSKTRRFVVAPLKVNMMRIFQSFSPKERFFNHP